MYKTSALIAGVLMAVLSLPLQAGTIVYTFTGTTDIAITSGSNTIPVGTPFSGTLSYDFPQTGTVSSFFGGTQSVFQFNSLTLIMNGQTVLEPAGNLVLYDNVTPPKGVPVGDSLYTFLPGTPVPPSTGSINGIAPNFIYLGFVDTSGAVFSGPALPQTLDLANFSSAFLGFNYGPLGTGNTDTIHPLKTLSGSTAVPEPSALVLLGSALALAFLRGRNARSS